MHLRNGPSWQISEGLDQGLALALFVRDRAGLAPYVVTEPDVGELEPAVGRPEPNRLGHDVDLGAAVREWPQWWDRALRTPEGRFLLPGLPAWGEGADLPTVTGLVQHHLTEFHDWLRPVQDVGRAVEHRRDGLQLTRYVNAFEGRLRRQVRPFRLRLRALPLREPVGWVVDEEQAVVSLRLLADPAALEAFLEPLILALA